MCSSSSRQLGKRDAQPSRNSLPCVKVTHVEAVGFEKAGRRRAKLRLVIKHADQWPDLVHGAQDDRTVAPAILHLSDIRGSGEGFEQCLRSVHQLTLWLLITGY